MKEIIAVIACELQTMGGGVKNKEETMKRDWIVLDFWQGVGEMQGLDGWWPSGRGDVHGPRQEDPQGLSCGPQRPETRGRGRVTRERDGVPLVAWPRVFQEPGLAGR